MIRGRDDPTDATQGFEEEKNGGIDVVKINITCKAGKREVGESCSMIRMADRTLVQTRLKTLQKHRSGERLSHLSCIKQIVRGLHLYLEQSRSIK